MAPIVDPSRPLSETLMVLSNAVLVSTKVINQVAGNDTSNTFQGAAITDAFLADAVAARLQAKLMPFVGGA